MIESVIDTTTETWIQSWDGVAIALLLPVTACMVVSQVNPYHALVIRGIFGAVAVLVYAIFGAADVALTEALVGTMLSITLYAIAVRASLNLRLGIVDEAIQETMQFDALSNSFNQLQTTLRHPLIPYHLRLEWVSYPTQQALETALSQREVHGICIATRAESDPRGPVVYQLQLRVQRLYEILAPGISPAIAQVTYRAPEDSP